MVIVLDLIVVSYRSPGDLHHFLQSVEKYPPDGEWNITIVDVDPVDAWDENPMLWISAPVTLIRTVTNVGYARAVNEAASRGSGEVIGIFNADTRLMKNVATDCVNALQSNESWAVIGPRQVDDTGRITHGGIFEKERGFHHRNSEQYSDIRDDATTVSGSAYFIKRQVWDELTTCSLYRAKHPEAQGAFLPTPHYFEETFCSYHARAHGYKIVYYGAATMIHQWHRASPRGGPADRQMKVSREIFREACDAHGIEHG